MKSVFLTHNPPSASLCTLKYLLCQNWGLSARLKGIPEKVITLALEQLNAEDLEKIDLNEVFTRRDI